MSIRLLWGGRADGGNLKSCRVQACPVRVVRLQPNGMEENRRLIRQSVALPPSPPEKANCSRRVWWATNEFVWGEPILYKKDWWCMTWGTQIIKIYRLQPKKSSNTSKSHKQYIVPRVKTEYKINICPVFRRHTHPILLCKCTKTSAAYSLKFYKEFVK